MLSVLTLPASVPQASVSDGLSVLNVPPIAPWLDGVFTRIRPAFIIAKSSTTRSSLA